MGGKILFFPFALLSLLSPFHVIAQTTTAASVVSSLANDLIPQNIYPPLTVTGQFPCLAANSYLILTDSQSSSATYPVWKCTSDCGSLSSGVGLMVFPATTTTGRYEVQNPPAGYPALEISNLAVITDSSFSPYTPINVQGPQPTTTSTFTYPAFPGLSLTIETTTPITAVLATLVAVPVNCQSSVGAGGRKAGVATSSKSALSSSSVSSGSWNSPVSYRTSVSASIFSSTRPPPQSSAGADGRIAGVAASSRSASSFSSASSSHWNSPASNRASVSAPISSRSALPPGATVITSTLAPSGSITTSRVISETFIPTVYSTLTGLTSTLITSSVVSLESNSATTIPITIYPGGSAWGIPSVEPGTPILPVPSVAPDEGLQLSSRGQSLSSTQYASSGFTTRFTSSAWGDDLPASLTAEPPPLDNPPASSLVAGLAIFSGTTSPTIQYVSTGVSSNTHSPTDHAKAFPIFWGHSHFCFLFCPLHGHCLFCGYMVDLLPGIYPPGSIKFPPGWTEPDVTITVEEDGTPTYDEDEEPTTTTTTSSTTSTSSTAFTTQTPHTSVNPTSSASSSAVSSGYPLCGFTCSSCAIIDLPSSTLPPDAKRNLQSAKAPIQKRAMIWPYDPPYDGDIDSFIWSQWNNALTGIVPMRRNDLHPSSSYFRPLMNENITIGIQGLFGCTSLIVASTQGIWMSHFWEDPSFETDDTPAPQQQLRFQQQVLDILGSGDGTTDFPGLLQYVQGNGAFSSDTHVRVILITPRHHWDPHPGVLRYPIEAQAIAKTVTDIFGGDWDAGDKGDLAAPVYFLDYTPEQEEEGEDWTSKGKALFQYDPVQGRCIDQSTGQPAQFAGQRLWFQDCSAPYLNYPWVAWPWQRVPVASGSKRRSLSEDETRDKGDQISLERRQDAWTPGAQPSIYPSCLAALEGDGISSATSSLISSTTSSASSSALSSAVSATNTLCGTKCNSCVLSTSSSKVKRSLDEDKAPKFKRTLDNPQNKPWDGNMNDFMSFQWSNKDLVNLDLRDDDDDDDDDDEEAPPSSAYFLPLEDSDVNFGVIGLYGCTSLIVTSTKGVWISHFWEEPAFDDSHDHPAITKEQQLDIFDREVLDILGPGDATDGFLGLEQYIGGGKAFGPDTYVQAVVVTPAEKQPNNMPDKLLYENMVEEILLSVYEFFGGDLETSDPGTMGAPVEVIAYLPRRNLPDIKEFTPFGKVLFQYDPVEGPRCLDEATGQLTQFAKSRLWLENRPVSYLDHYWKAWDNQLIPGTPTQENPGSKPRGLPSSNETIDEPDDLFPVEKRQKPWTAGEQPSVYPACYAAIENTGTGFPEATNVPVGPDGPITIIYTETVAAPAGSGTVLYGCTATTVEHNIPSCTGSMIGLTTLFPSPETSTTSTTTFSYSTVLPHFSSPPKCANQDTFTLYDLCKSSCNGGSCKEFQEKKVRELCEDDADCGSGSAEPAWRCFCKITVVTALG